VVLVKNASGEPLVVKFFKKKDRFAKEEKILRKLGQESDGKNNVIPLLATMESPSLWGFVFYQYSLEKFVPQNDFERTTYMFQVLTVTFVSSVINMLYRL
jgi:hypothetical protein